MARFLGVEAKQQGDVLLPTRLEGLAKAVSKTTLEAQGVAAAIKGGLDLLGWRLEGSTCIVTGDGQKWGRIDLTITPPKLVLKLAAEVFRDQVDHKHNEYLWDKGAVEDGFVTDWP